MVRPLVLRVKRSLDKLNLANLNSDFKNEIFSEILANESKIRSSPLESCELFKYLYLISHKHTPLLEYKSFKTPREDLDIYNMLVGSISDFLKNKAGLLEKRILKEVTHMYTYFSQNYFTPKELLGSLRSYYLNNSAEISQHCHDLAENANQTEILNWSVGMSLCGVGNSKLIEKIAHCMSNSKWISSTTEKIKGAYILSVVYTLKSYFNNKFEYIGEANCDNVPLEIPIKILTSHYKSQFLSLNNAVFLLPIFAHIKYKTGVLDILGQLILERSNNLTLWNTITTIDALYKLDCRFDTLLKRLSEICLDEIESVPSELLPVLAIQLHRLKESTQLLVPEVSLRISDIIASTEDVRVLKELKNVFKDYGIKNPELETAIAANNGV